MDSTEKNITRAAEVLAASIEVLAKAVLFAAFKAAKGPGAVDEEKRLRTFLNEFKQFEAAQ